METIQPGTTDLQVPVMGVGTIMWAGMPGAIKMEIILEAMDDAAVNHQKTLAQVAPNWLLTN
jgi:aryl-alcohol dehydrogenase-like predicted oxidoreductase